MKKLNFLLATSFLFTSLTATAAFIDTKVQQTQNTAKQVRELAEDTPVTLQGKIVKQLKKEKYLFQDMTGERIVIEIDDEVWKGRDVKPSDTILISGTVDIDKKEFKKEQHFLKMRENTQDMQNEKMEGKDKGMPPKHIEIEVKDFKIINGEA